MTTFAVHCRGCRFASLLLRSLPDAQAKASEHAREQAHRVMVTRTEERAVSVHAPCVACEVTL